MIQMLGQGMLYQMHHNRDAMLTQAEKRRALLLVSGITVCITTGVILWLIH